MNNDKKTVMIALGGNALSPKSEAGTIKKQFEHTKKSLKSLMHFVKQNYNICITHGNGPQVGAELARNEIAETEVPPLPLGVLVANTVFMTDVETTLKNLVNVANGDSKNTGWHMELIGTDTIKVISNIPGVLYNGLSVNVGLSGNLTVTMVDDPTAYGSGVDNCVEFGIADIYTTNAAPVEIL